MRLNKEELAVGFVLQLPFYFVIHLWVLPLALISGLLWAIGGAGYKPVRRFGVPALTCAALISHPYTLFAYPVACVVCSLGYGEESMLWNLFRKYKDHNSADFLTRTTTYLLYWLAFGILL